jgi:hypothetical protein
LSATAYVSGQNPGFSQYYILNYNLPQNFSSVSISCKYCQRQGVTNFDVQTSVDGRTNWTTVASSGTLSYATNNETVETKTVTFTTVTNMKFIRLKINNANLQWLHFAVNEIAVN